MTVVSDTELNYLEANFVELRQQYAGMWIAIVGENVVAAAATPTTLRGLLDDLPYEIPFVHRMPAWGERMPDFAL